MSEPLHIAWLTTGRGPGSFGAFEYTLEAIQQGLPVSMDVLFLNRERGEHGPTDRLVALAEERGVPVETLSSVRFRKARGGKLSQPGEPLQPWRLEYDAAVAERLAKYGFALGVMFGYMLIATEPLFGRFRFINDHPAAPDGPVGTYEDVIQELMRAGARESGCMMNVVTGELDRGPLVSYCRFGIRDADNAQLWAAYEAGKGEAAAALFADIRGRGVERERPFVVETLRAVASGELAVPPVEAVDLTGRVERARRGDSGLRTQD